MSTSEPPPLPTNRPALVWVISIFYVVSVGWVALSFALIFSGLIPLTDVQKAYFQAQTVFDYESTALIGGANLVGAVLLLLLRRQAFPFFLTAFSFGLIQTLYQIVTKNWLGAIGGPGLVGAVIGWGISIAIILYTWRLVSKGVLK
ncbi:MAG: hypothetical protein IAE97_01080 [Chthoniobacterales bacterium]|nr:hypothetical protein [Chthoniobacterales bacterium]